MLSLDAVQKTLKADILCLAYNEGSDITWMLLIIADFQVISSFSLSRGWKISSSSSIYLRSAEDLEIYVKNHRLTVNKNRTPHGELLFYGEIIRNLITWLTNSLPTASVGTTWKMFVSLNEVSKMGKQKEPLRAS